MRQQFRRTLPLLFAVVGALVAAPRANASILTVGPGKTYKTVASAVAAARDGDVVRVQAGTYTNDFAYVNKQISIVGVGGMARMVATQNIPNGKAIFVTSNNVTLNHIEFAGARVADANGAGIRYEGGNLVIKKCYFHDNENGILATSVETGSIVIGSSEFASNGRGDGYTHGVYVNRIASLRVLNSYFHNTKVGHHIKSRALQTTIRGNRIDDGINGTASYNIDLPNGGVSVVADNNIVQRATSQNPALIHFGGEGTPYAGSSLRVANNTLQNYRSSATGVLNHTNITVTINGNKLYGLPTVASGPNSQSNNTVLSTPVPVDTSSPWMN
ncbi:Ca2+-binding protein, RTX toxin-related (fragment) [uncultured Defluviicoccus sp.]|uniref:Ca2+-binding protein, RTX toxin-related n=1 Tax=metagenome TaxID=256318 RepID=A0A380T8E9_9ZZZZ